MKAAMHLAPSQVTNKVRLKTVGTIEISKATLIQAGLVNYEVMCIGSPGGQAGDATGSSNKVVEFGSGGGGGGSIRVKGLIADLPDIITCVVGPAGTVGASVGNNVQAGNGGDGADASFAGTIIGKGGKGATGGKANVVSGVPQNSTVSTGGAGGSNSSNLGFGGVGGHGNDYDDSTAITGATAGTWVDSDSNHGGGRGGGGGAGAGYIGGFNPPYLTMGDRQNGASGATSTHTGPGGTKGTYNGGTGGGANGSVITGTDEYFGGSGQLGAVLVNFT